MNRLSTILKDHYFFPILMSTASCTLGYPLLLRIQISFNNEGWTQGLKCNTPEKSLFDQLCSTASCFTELACYLFFLRLTAFLLFANSKRTMANKLNFIYYISKSICKSTSILYHTQDFNAEKSTKL